MIQDGILDFVLLPVQSNIYLSILFMVLEAIWIMLTNFLA